LWCDVQWRGSRIKVEALGRWQNVNLGLEIKGAWIEKWKGSLDRLSANQGCGRCVHIFDVEGPVEALDEIPSQLFCGSDWAGLHGRSDLGQRKQRRTT
jgi:hypothetical protein